MVSKDQKTARKASRDSDALERKVLKSDAVPSIFQNLPEYYQVQVPEKRSETTSKESRFQRQYDAYELQAKEFLAADNVLSLEDLNEKLNMNDNWARDTLKLKQENKLTLYSIEENDLGRPSVKYSLTIMEDLQFILWCREVKVSPHKVAHISKTKLANTCAVVENIIVFLRNMSDEKLPPPKNTVEYCVSVLNKTIPELDEKTAKKVSFLKEQLSLSMISNHSRRYSPDLLACAALWLEVSPALYKQIRSEEILTLPTERHLKDLTKAFTVETGISEATVKYLKARFSKLNDREKVVNLMADEVYSSKRVEYSGGTFYGYENQTVTKTILCFMIILCLVIPVLSLSLL